MKTSFKIPEYIKEGFDKYKYVIIVCAIGLIFALWPSKAEEKESLPPLSAEELQYDINIDAFCRSLEESLGSINGVGRINIVLTVKNGPESIYAYDQVHSETSGQSQPSRSTNSQLVKVSGGGEETPVIRKINYPTFLGAVVICDGGENSKIQLELTQAIKSLTGITADNIVILKMKN